MQKVLMRWQANSLFGWGVLGLNLLELWSADADIQPLMGDPITPQDLQGVDALRLAMIQPAIAASNQFLEQVRTGAADLRQSSVVVIDSFGNGLRRNTRRGSQVGIRNIARCIFDDSRIDTPSIIAGYDNVLCASEWAARLLRAATSQSVTLIHEGIDHSLFFPGPRSGILDPECFYVFCGGKIEFRKGQDLVILAFREFAARHDDAVLVAAWHSPWPQISVGFQQNLAAPLRLDSNGVLDVRGWAIENGISPHQFIALPAMPNSFMPAVLREMDCALQVSRCEPCTNLPAKEAMACGVPVILANNTGTKELIDSDNCLALNSQDPVAGQSGVGTNGWGESRVEEIVAALETLYTDTQMRKRIAARGAEWILERHRTWRDHAKSLKNHVLTLG